MDTDNVYVLTPDGELYHHGIKGMKWGVRRFQKKDGSLTPSGKKRYSDDAEGPQKSPTSQQTKTSKAVAVAKKGKQYVNKIDGKKVTTIISATAAVASGALWAASAFVPGGAGITFVRGSLSAITAAINLADNLAPPPKQSNRK